ncbi:hypothetical protein SCP_0409270 [Sparassis crispa]|uniref:Chromatin modification-related protein n=1 Tax=Sparassis crispa TaxID=139825 RepID=A0A401GK57_9APHY|nr:hypothetical protein SCP_0409270 [Sparassis crispa]GBE82543.1 hypothetical protein SCP_0409270 [Sparassis crispa]
MSYRKNRKRRRSQAFPEDEANVIEQLPVVEVAPEQEQEPRGPEDAVDAADATSDKEREVWDAFKEENYEVLEQLPLSLQRSFTLMLELDQQVHDYEAHILPSLRKYIELRTGLEGKFDAVQEQQQQNAGELAGASGEPDVEMSRPLPPPSTPGPSSGKSAVTTSPVTNATFSHLTRSSERPSTTRGLLTQVAQLSEEVVRASNEKVNVARFAYDLVDRYIRDLDRAIKEQETSISLGLRPGTHPASIILPDVVVPATRSIRITHSPSLEIDIESMHGVEPAETGGLNLGIPPPEHVAEAVAPPAPVRPRRRGKPKWSRKKSSKPTTENAADAEEPAASKKQTLTLTVPPLASVALDAVDMPVDPNEPRYCYCNQVSFGEMIACDNPGCKLEWFHLGCAGLTQAPEGNTKWYCRDCEKLIAPRRKTRQR